MIAEPMRQAALGWPSGVAGFLQSKYWCLVVEVNDL